MTFTANGEHLISGCKKSVQVWGAKNGAHIATMPAKEVYCVAASRNGRWIAGGEWGGEVIVWDATTYQRVFSANGTGTSHGYRYIWDVDFSPDSTRLVSADDSTATIWDFIGARQQVRTLVQPNQSVQAAKYSPQGDRIATATPEYVRVWDSNDGRLLVDLKVRASAWRGLLWHNHHLFVQTNDKSIKEIDPATGSTVSEWVVTDPSTYACIALPQHGKFIACRVNKTITFWDTTTRTQLSPVEHTEDIYSMACSSDGQLLAMGAWKINVKDISSTLPPVSVCFVSCYEFIFTTSQCHRIF